MTVALTVGCSETAPPTAPDTTAGFTGVVDHVLIISIDAVRPDHVSAYGYERETTPAIDSVARDGIVFNRAYAQANWTKPSIASLFTGLYQRHHGVTVGSGRVSADGSAQKAVESVPLPAQLPTMAEAFAAAGFRTAGYVENSHLTVNQGFQRGFEDYGRFKPADVYLKDWLSGLDREEKTFSFIHLIGPHDPYDNEDRDFQPYRERFEKYDSPVDFLDLSYKKRNDLTEIDVMQAVSLYDSELAYFDGKQVARLLEWLRSSGRYDDLLIIITSDHGEELYDHGDWAHGHSLYEEVTRVPLIVKLPLSLQQASPSPIRRIDELVELIDLFPTFADLCGLDAPENLDGQSLVNLIANGSDPNLDPVAITEYGRTNDYAIIAAAIVSGDLKMIENYSPEHGPGILGFSRTPEKRFYRVDGMAEHLLPAFGDTPEATEIRDLLISRLGPSNLLALKSEESVRLTKEEVDRLEALGYLE